MLEFVLTTFIWTCRRVSVDDRKGAFSYLLDSKTTIQMTMGNKGSADIFKLGTRRKRLISFTFELLCN